MNDSNMKVLVTGGSGRIGQKLVVELVRKNFDVTVLDVVKPSTGIGKFVMGSLLDPESVKRNTKDIDVIVHLAAIPFDLPKDYKKLWDINFTGTFHVLDAAVQNHVKKVVFASSICTLGIGFWNRDPIEIRYFPVDEHHPTKPTDLYGVSKLVGEQLCYMYTMRFGLATICLRLASVCFTNPNGGASPGWAEEFDRDIKPYYLNPAAAANKPERDWVWEYVDENDVVHAFILAVEKNNVTHEIFNIGAPDTPTDLDSLELAKLYYPEARVQKESEFRANRKRPLYDISKARTNLGYSPKVRWPEMAVKLLLK